MCESRLWQLTETRYISVWYLRCHLRPDFDRYLTNRTCQSWSAYRDDGEQQKWTTVHYSISNESWNTEYLYTVKKSTGKVKYTSIAVRKPASSLTCHSPWDHTVTRQRSHYPMQLRLVLDSVTLKGMHLHYTCYCLFPPVSSPFLFVFIFVFFCLFRRPV